MTGMTLYLGNKNYSSWSLRAWLVMRRSGAAFREELLDLSAPDVREAIARHSGARRVPFLRDGDLVVWDSLAIAEYLAEKFPEARLWPAEPAARAVARSVSAEMHSGFTALRRHMPMNVRRSSPGRGRAEGVEEDIRRIQAIWRDCRQRFGAGGPFLFGAWSIADAMFAPVVSRFRTYAVELEDEVCRAWSDVVWRLPELREWREAAAGETSVIPHYDL